MTGRPASLLRQGAYSLAWVKDLYDQTSAWWGPNTDWVSYRSRAAALERIAGEWLAPGVSGSLEMIERCRLDPVHSRWTDEWRPVATPDAALAQTDLERRAPAGRVAVRGEARAGGGCRPGRLG